MSRCRLSLIAALSVPLAFLLLIPSFNIFVVIAGEPQWVEVRSPDFSVITDAGEKRGREVAMRFEQMRAVFGTLMTKANVSLPIPLQIVAFRNTKEMRQIAPLFNGKPTQLAGLFQGGSDRSFIMLDMSVENPWTVVFHEYAHQLMNGNLQLELPPWFEEGFAEYFSSIEVDNKEARVGKIPNEEYMVLQQLGMMKVADLLRVQHNSQTYNESGDHRSTFYAESGILMHYIYDNQLLPQAAVYFDLAENKHVPIEGAIQQAFGMSAGQFDKVLRQYVYSGRYKYYPVPNPPNIASNNYTVVPLSPADGNAVLADIHLHSRDYQQRAMSEFQEILKSDPHNAAANRGLGYAYLQQRDFPHAAEYFKLASELNSHDPRLHYYSALLVTRENSFSGGGADLETMKRELETSISLDPTFADSYALLAFAQSTSGHPADAIVNMRKAVAISPRNEGYLFNLANLYVANGQLDQAFALLQTMQVSDNPELVARVAAMRARVQQFKQMKERNVSGDVIALRPDAASRPEEESDGPAVMLPPASGPAKFLTGTLTGINCATPPSATLTVLAGGKNWKMNVADRNHLVLIGADDFSCSWEKKKVALNYRAVSNSENEGDVVSLEIQ
jgi:Flp pilus assembly protein TadD